MASSEPTPDVEKVRKGGLRLAAHAFELECGAGRGVRSGIGLSARAFRSVARGWKCTFHSRALRGGERRTRRDAPEKHGKTEPKVVCWGSSVIRKVPDFWVYRFSQ